MSVENSPTPELPGLTLDGISVLHTSRCSLEHYYLGLALGIKSRRNPLNPLSPSNKQAKQATRQPKQPKQPKQQGEAQSKGKKHDTVPFLGRTQAQAEDSDGGGGQGFVGLDKAGEECTEAEHSNPGPSNPNLPPKIGLEDQWPTAKRQHLLRVH
eukprot:gene14120-biopygen3841